MKYFHALLAWLKHFSRPNPSRDWYAVLGTALICGTATIVAGLYWYVGLQSGAVIVPMAPAHVSAPSVSRTQLSNVINEYQARALNYQAGNFVSK